MRPYIYIQAMTWEDVFADWKKREANQGWETVWRERGFASWEAWRISYLVRLKPTDRDWALVDIHDPQATVPLFWAMGFRGWKQYYPAETRRARLRDIAAHPALADNPKVVALSNDFPKETRLVAMRCGEDVMLVEGMHRAATIALFARRGERIAERVTLALCDLPASERSLFDAATAQPK